MRGRLTVVAPAVHHAVRRATAPSEALTEVARAAAEMPAAVRATTVRGDRRTGIAAGRTRAGRTVTVRATSVRAVAPRTGAPGQVLQVGDRPPTPGVAGVLVRRTETVLARASARRTVSGPVRATVRRTASGPGPASVRRTGTVQVPGSVPRTVTGPVLESASRTVSVPARVGVRRMAIGRGPSSVRPTLTVPAPVIAEASVTAVPPGTARGTTAELDRPTGSATTRRAIVVRRTTGRASGAMRAPRPAVPATGTRIAAGALGRRTGTAAATIADAKAVLRPGSETRVRHPGGTRPVIVRAPAGPSDPVTTARGDLPTVSGTRSAARRVHRRAIGGRSRGNVVDRTIVRSAPPQRRARVETVAVAPHVAVTCAATAAVATPIVVVSMAAAPRAAVPIAPATSAGTAVATAAVVTSREVLAPPADGRRAIATSRVASGTRARRRTSVGLGRSSLTT